jgi:hypothetical protein
LLSSLFILIPEGITLSAHLMRIPVPVANITLTIHALFCLGTAVFNVILILGELESLLTVLANPRFHRAIGSVAIELALNSLE